MRKLFILLLGVLALSAGTAFAQTDDASTSVNLNINNAVTENYWAGLSFGYPGIYGHFGLKDVLGAGGDVRANLGYAYVGGQFSLGANALFDINLNVDAPLGLYLGGGPYINVGNRFIVGVEGLAGLEYRLSDFGFNPGGVFFELGPAVGTGGFEFRSRVGFNYYF